MKTLSFKQLMVLFTVLTGLLFANTRSNAQAKLTAQTLSVQLAGTSTLHDWIMKTDDGNSDITLVVGNNKVTSISSLHFTLLAKTLKSGHSLMDKNTYKALNTDKNPNISFALTSANITPLEGNMYQLKCLGKLTIAGFTRETELLANGKYNTADKSFVVTGSKKFKMTDYEVKPPTVMMGTIKTGNDITVSYNLKFIK